MVSESAFPKKTEKSAEENGKQSLERKKKIIQIEVHNNK